jgi:hypothetical protein
MSEQLQAGAHPDDDHGGEGIGADHQSEYASHDRQQTNEAYRHPAEPPDTDEYDYPDS